MNGTIVYFEQREQDHTIETLTIAKAHAENTGLRAVVLASTTGATAKAALELFRDSTVKLIVVPHQFGFSAKGNAFPKEHVSELRAMGHEVHFGTRFTSARCCFTRRSFTQTTRLRRSQAICAALVRVRRFALRYA